MRLVEFWATRDLEWMTKKNNDAESKRDAEPQWLHSTVRCRWSVQPTPNDMAVFELRSNGYVECCAATHSLTCYLTVASEMVAV